MDGVDDVADLAGDAACPRESPVAGERQRPTLGVDDAILSPLVDVVLFREQGEDLARVGALHELRQDQLAVLADSLYREDIATFEAGEAYNQSDADGFIRLNALRLKLRPRSET